MFLLEPGIFPVSIVHLNYFFINTELNVNKKNWYKYLYNLFGHSNGVCFLLYNRWIYEGIEINIDPTLVFSVMSLGKCSLCLDLVFKCTLILPYKINNYKGISFN